MKKILIFFVLLFFVFSFLTSATDKININTATLEQLDELTGIGPKYAKAIIDARPFSSVDDLTRVKGIGEKTLQKIKDQGLACVDCPSVIPAQAGIQSENAELDSGFRQNDTVTNDDTTTNDDKEEIKTYPNGIFINEILPSPEGSDETSEWIELYNSNNFDVDLSGWKIKDTNGTPTTYTFLENTKISAMGFWVAKRPDTKITLNNDADGIILLAPNGNNVDSVEYNAAIKNLSYNKTSSGWQWSETLTPGLTNIITKSSAESLSKTKKSVNNNGVEAGLADISQTINTNQDRQMTNPWFLFLTAIILTTISAITTLLIKFKLNKHVRT